MNDPHFHWDSFFLGANVAIFINVGFSDYMPSPLVTLSSTSKAILGLAGLGCCLLYFLYTLHKPRIIPPRNNP